MKGSKTDPVRLRDVPAQYDVSGVGASELFRAASVSPRLSDAEVELALRRVRAVDRGGRPLPFRWAFRFASLPILFVGLTVGAATSALITRHMVMQRSNVDQPQSEPRAAPQARRQPTPNAGRASSNQISPHEPPDAHLQPPVPPLAAGGEPGPSLPLKKAHRRLALAPRPQVENATAVALPHEQLADEATQDPVAPPAAGTQAWALPPSEEVQMLREAVRALRAEQRPAVAVDMLERFSARYPKSNLMGEATLLRIEALVVLGDSSRALALLNRSAGQTKLPAEFTVLRAELLAKQGQCSEATQIFGSLIAQGLARSLHERSLYGRAVCLARQGDQQAARSAYEAYRAQFPQGRFITSVKRALSGSSPAVLPQ